jgi:Condensation domain
VTGGDPDRPAVPPEHDPAPDTGAEGDMAQRIIVPFTGTGTGIAGLTWGQRELWVGMCRQHTWMPIGAVRELPPGTTVESIVDELRYMMARYPSLRTRLRLSPDAPPHQVLAGSGEVTLEVVEAGGADPAEVAAEVMSRYERADHDFTADWPVRMAVVCRSSVPTHQVAIFCHLVMDGAGAQAMLADLARREPGTGTPPGPPGALQPLEQARWQDSPAGRRQCEAALRYWERLLWTIEPRRFPGSTDPRHPRQWEIGFTSPALHLAVRVICARTGLDSSPVLLGLFGVALARVTGIDPVVTQVVVSNRFRRGLAGTVSPVSQNILLAIDVAGASVDEAAGRAWRRILAGYKHGYYDPVRLEELVRRVGRERGVELDLSCFFNDRRLHRLAGAEGAGAEGAGAGAALPTAAQVTAALPATRLRWLGRYDRPERLFLSVNEAESAIDMSLYGNTEHLAPADLAALLRGMEEAAVTAVTGGP